MTIRGCSVSKSERSGRVSLYSVSKKLQGLGTKVEREGQEVAAEIK